MYVWLAVALLAGSALGFLVARVLVSRKIGYLEAERSTLNNRVTELEASLNAEKEARIRAETQLSELKRTEEAMLNAFKAMSMEVMDRTYQGFLEKANETFKRVLAEAKGDLTEKEKNIESLVMPMKELLDKLNSKLSEIEKEREGAFRSLASQISELSRRSEDLRKETERLYSALRRPQVRGKWGELTLKNAVELAGLSEHCDFQEQVYIETRSGSVRPDMVIRLPGGRFIAVDAKVPVDHFFDALESDSEKGKREALQKHAASMRSHLKSLSNKVYWKELGRSPDFMVMFIPADSFLSAALEVDRSLMEDALKEGIVIATPTLLVALLKVVALTWREFTLTQEMKEIAQLGKELFRRASTFVDNMSKLGKNLSSAVDAYNKAVGSWEGRFVPHLRKFAQFDASGDLKHLQPVERAVRELRKDG
ncbi:DNA recombination protein RmuC [Thermosulfidibacter takaii ABI70S6]|uniref:DNA recombination protein RmuC n=1 Tax=Thermosulfidibacter takaii (strain DSM 17441 / JCM 13301 / NBRC 103674 / ABI70S6) TaxID=1298851 RepID=A0A0S3QSC2_THET7|nr:DNA recombination protein RmuC [Thermosulfidibacter takaii]BAT71185.1 DNA recombination protein RmuC [Thermosulfidibacter takaii ABI70S6]